MAKKSNNKSWFARLKSRPILWNLTLIAVVLVSLLVLSYIALAVGTRHGMRRTVPDFTGLGLKDAQYYAEQRGLKLIINDSLYVPAYPGGMVLEQLPKGGVAVKEGRKIYITINSFAQKKLPMPYVAGRSLRQAKNMLESAGFGIEKLEYVEDIATNYVLAQYLNGVEITEQSNIKIEKGTGVVLRVGVSPDQNITTVPRLIGRKLFDAKGRLWEQGLNVGQVTYDEGITLLNEDDARVCRQSVIQSSQLPLGSTVSIHLTLDKQVVEAAAAEAERAVAALLKQRELADSLARVAADSLRMVNEAQVEPQQTTDDEFFF
ncbi:MAG: PASTA domain-containing protein [Alistipes sp.]|nr:PASTA domain-containing protein [Alistipes sp.]MBQ9962709.1 PASTA domain-containing protein [Alistipes sp.]